MAHDAFKAHIPCILNVESETCTSDPYGDFHVNCLTSIWIPKDGDWAGMFPNIIKIIPLGSNKAQLRGLGELGTLGLREEGTPAATLAWQHSGVETQEKYF